MVCEVVKVLFNVLIVLLIELVVGVLLYNHLVYLVGVVANLGVLQVVVVAQLLAVGVLGQLDPHDGVLAATEAVDLANSLRSWALHLHDCGVARVVLAEVLQLLLVECLRFEVHVLGVEATGDHLRGGLGLASSCVHQGILWVERTQREAHLRLGAHAWVAQ